MASRLNAKHAAALTVQRAKEIEAQARQDEGEKKLRAAQASKHARLWKVQANQLVEAALSGEYFLRVGSKLIGGDRLEKLGFAIAYVDKSSLLEQQRQEEIERKEQKKAEERALKESERLRHLEAMKLQPEVDKKISEFINKIQKEDRYKGMDSTREMVVEHFRRVIGSYANGISAGISSRGALFAELFNGSLFVYKPIDSLRDEVQALQDALHRLEKVRRDLPDVENDEFESFDYDLWGIEDVGEHEGDDQDDLKLGEFKRYLESWECDEFLQVEDRRDYFQVEWRDANVPEKWVFQDLISAQALAWLSGHSGQALLEAIESEIQSAIDSASTSIHIPMRWDGEQCICDVGGETYGGTPRSNHLSDILKILKYKTQEKHLEDGSSLLQVSWE